MRGGYEIGTGGLVGELRLRNTRGNTDAAVTADVVVRNLRMIDNSEKGFEEIREHAGNDTGGDKPGMPEYKERKSKERKPRVSSHFSTFQISPPPCPSGF